MALVINTRTESSNGVTIITGEGLVHVHWDPGKPDRLFFTAPEEIPIARDSAIEKAGGIAAFLESYAERLRKRKKKEEGNPDGTQELPPQSD